MRQTINFNNGLEQCQNVRLFLKYNRLFRDEALTRKKSESLKLLRQEFSRIFWDKNDSEKILQGTADALDEKRAIHDPANLSIPEVDASVAIGSVLDDADSFGKGSRIAIGASDEDRIFSNKLNLKRKKTLLKFKEGNCKFNMSVKRQMF